MHNLLDEFISISNEEEVPMDSKEFALALDKKDELFNFRSLFEYPKMKQLPFVDLTKVHPDDDCIYLAGNSLGLMPKRVWETMKQMLQKWADFGVYGHHFGDHPWYICDEELVASMCRIVGAHIDEVALMNQLTSNLHFLFLSFYRPTKTRYKILFEDRAFPSDHYTFESQARLHGLDPNEALITVKPRDGEYTVRLEDIVQIISEFGSEICVICFSGVQYFTGQNFDIPTITKYGHDVGAFVGWDLGHSVGNVELDLHNWDVDFAVWTTYKYLNAGAGNTGAAFLHSRLFSQNLPYLTGWWGHSIETRMEMTNKMEPGKGIRKYKMSTPSALHSAALRASLEIFDLVDMKSIRLKSIYLTWYFEFLLLNINEKFGKTLLEIITPSKVQERGAQLSVIFHGLDLDYLHNALKQRGLVCDQRKPNVIRMAASPLYNSYLDVHRAFSVLCEILSNQ